MIENFGGSILYLILFLIQLLGLSFYCYLILLNPKSIINEYGGAWWLPLNVRDKFFSWGHGDHVRPKSIQEVYDRMDSLTEVVLKTKHIQGFCYTQLTDVEQETNGVYLYDRKTKFNMKKIKKIFKDKSLKLKKGYIQ